ncbi:MaoC family dehydratase [Nocardia sp. CNY236]|uniref:MaoC family dehydratase n=1 Tax=Nocardia sp. CNY236 TaxID=1169152 RepID=UPI000424AD08|nr:MaoC family dehydratase [Nocardia sp. CNY236]
MGEPMTFTMATLRTAAGTELGASDWIAIDQQRIDAFAEATEDRQWIHVDPERAQAGPFGTTIAHGYLTLSLLPVMMSRLFRITDAGAQINYGVNRVRFPAPVPSGSRVRGRAMVTTVDEVPGGLQVTCVVTVERDGGDKPVCVAETVMRALQ